MRPHEKHKTTRGEKPQTNGWEFTFWAGCLEGLSWGRQGVDPGGPGLRGGLGAEAVEDVRRGRVGVGDGDTGGSDYRADTGNGSAGGSRAVVAVDLGEVFQVR